MQINSVSLSLINFCKFIINNKKWVLYKPKRRKLSGSSLIANIHVKNVLVYKDIELIYTLNIYQYYNYLTLQKQLQNFKL